MKTDKTDTLVKLFDKMKLSKGLPALSSTVETVLSKLNDEDYSEVVLDITSDFALTQQVLQIANSAMYAPFAKNIPSVSKALQVLGTEAVRSIVLSVPLVANFEDPSDAELARTTVASVLARSLTKDRKEAFAIASLFYNLGTILTSKYLSEEMSQVLELSPKLGPELAAKTVLGYTFPEIGEAVSKYWRLPGEIEAIVNHTSKDELLVVASFASKVVTQIQEDNKRGIQELVDTFDLPDIDKTALHTTIEDLVKSQPLIFIKRESTEQALEEALWALTRSKFSCDKDLAYAMFDKLSRILKTSNCLYAKPDGSKDIRTYVAEGEDEDRLSRLFLVPAVFEPTAFGIAVKKKVDLALLDVSSLRKGTLPTWFSEIVPELASILILPVTIGKFTGLLVYTWKASVKLTDREFEALSKLRNLFNK
jgi:HD-like signal output (HDOD) protein